MRLSMLLVVVSVAALMVSGASGSAGSVQSRWVVRDLGTLTDGFYSEATALNERGQIVGVETPDWKSSHVFLWQKGRMVALTGLRNGYPQAINAKGQIIGWLNPVEDDFYFWMPWDQSRYVLWEHGRTTSLRGFRVADNAGTMLPPEGFFAAINDRGQIAGTRGRYGHWAAAIWEQGKITSLGALPGSTSTASSDINERGQVIGSSFSKAQGGTTVERGFLWSDGQMTDLGTLAWHATLVHPVAINAVGQVAGDGTVAPNNRHAFLWQDGKMTDLGTLGGRDCRVSGLNDRGEVVGSSSMKSAPRTPSVTHAFLWRDGRMLDLGTLGGKVTYAVAVNNRGQVIGSSATGTGDGPRAFVWESGTMHALPTLGGGASSASGINDHGQIVGWAAMKNGQRHAVLWTLRSG
jgi:probable HAF family extracellular repeat protein